MADTKGWWHLVYWAKWHLIVKPKLIKELRRAQAKAVDDILTSNILRARIK